MDQKHRPRTDAMFERDAGEDSKQLDDIERQLKATRPQPPRLDIASLQRLADEATVDAVVELAPDRKSHRAMPGGGRRIGGRVLVIAASWVCGVSVGALVMFVLMSRTSPTPVRNNKVVDIQEETPSLNADSAIAERDPDQLDDSPAAEPPVRREVRSSLFTMVRDPLEHTNATYLTEGPTLQVGMYLRRNAELPMWPFQSTTVEKKQEVPTDSERTLREHSTPSLPAPEPGPPVSRRELMQEFLGDSSGAVL